MVLVQRGDQWKITHDTAMTVLNAIWYNVNRSGPSFFNGMQPGTSGMT